MSKHAKKGKAVSETRLTIEIDPERKRKFQFICAAKGQTMKERLEDLLDHDISQHDNIVAVMS